MVEVPVSLLRVTRVARLTPGMVRITFSGEGLGGLDTWPDQQLKLCFPKPGQTVPRLPEPDGDVMRWYQAYLAIPEDERPWLRSYTVRAHDPASATIDIDFVLHAEAGPATRWAWQAKPGDTLGRYGPSASYARPLGSGDWLLLAGDETALPAIGTLLESLPPGRRAIVFVEVKDAGEEQKFETRAEVSVHWVPRGGVPARHGDALLEAVRAAEFPPGRAFAWLAGEAGAVRALRRHLVEIRGIDKRAIHFSGYWRLELTQDDDPTDDDLADAKELVASAEVSAFDKAYDSGSAPWVIGEPQPAIVALAREGRIHGQVLDPGCGTGENSIHLARLGFDVHGLDASPLAIERANANAAGLGIGVRFEVADVLSLGEEPAYDTVVDSALFHVFAPRDRIRYVHALRRVCRPGAVVHVLALSDRGPEYGPQVSDSDIRDAFGEGWLLEELRPSEYRGVVGENGELGDLPAWLARVRREGRSGFAADSGVGQ